MTFEQFLAAWNRAVAESGLPPAGPPRATLDLGSLGREYSMRVEPAGGQFAKPFNVTAALSFRWSPLQTARAVTIEEDVLVELLGREGEDRDTERPWVRVDIVLSATLPYGQPLVMPAPDRWAAWAHEVMARLTEIDPVVEDEEIDAFGAWQGSPTARFACAADGSLQLEGIELEAWQGIRVPRHWDDPEREPDEPPDGQLGRMFSRVRRSLLVWGEVLDQLGARRAFS